MPRRSGRTPFLIALIVLASMAVPAGATIVPVVDRDSFDRLDHTFVSVASLDLTPLENYLRFSEGEAEADVDPDECFTPSCSDAAAGVSTTSGAPGDSTSQELPGAATTLLGTSGGALLLMAQCLRRGRNWATGKTPASSRPSASRAAGARTVRRCWYRENGLVYATCVTIRGRRRG